MQTFLPHPSFAASAAVLDSPRLGKQRVETLQILRALIVPTYGWQRHPAVQMWRGAVPALTAYGLATVQEWRGRGFADAVREQLLEFAPEVDGLSQEELAARGLLPAWIGEPALHESHRSRLIAKAPEIYRPLFPGTPEDLDYVWPPGVEEEAAPAPHLLPVVRVAALGPWLDRGLVGLPPVGPRGRVTRAWTDQLRGFEDDLEPGVVVGVLADDEPAVLRLATVTGPAAPAGIDGEEWTAVAVDFEGEVARASLPVPAALQDPRRFFVLRLPAPLPTAAVDAGD